MEQFDRQNGNVLFLILIAVALFAALSYAVTQSTRGGGNADDETRLIETARVVEYGAAVKSAILRMRLIKGTQDDEISFDSPSWGFANYQHGSPQPAENNVFNSDGGGIGWQNFSNLGVLKFVGGNSVQGIGACADNSSADCKDLMMLLIDIPLEMCIELNEQLGIVNTGGVPPTDNILTGVPGTASDGVFSGTYGSNFATSAYIDASETEGSEAGCVNDTGDSIYIYYHVLIAR